MLCSFCLVHSYTIGVHFACILKVLAVSRTSPLHPPPMEAWPYSMVVTTPAFLEMASITALTVSSVPLHPLSLRSQPT